MEIANEFSLGVPLERAWPLLTDLERVAPAMPGVTVEGSDGDELRATMRVKVGPIKVSYRTTVALTSADEASRTAVLKASGRELRGGGTLAATVTAVLRADGNATVVALTTDLAVTGRIAQMGGGVMREVADRMLGQFARQLAVQLEAPDAASESASDGPFSAAASERAAEGSSSATASDPAAAQRPSSAAAAPAVAASAPASLDLGSALLPSGASAGAFLGAFAGTFLGALLAALLLPRTRR